MFTVVKCSFNRMAENIRPVTGTPSKLNEVVIEGNSLLMTIIPYVASAEAITLVKSKAPVNDQFQWITLAEGSNITNIKTGIVPLIIATGLWLMANDAKTCAAHKEWQSPNTTQRVITFHCLVKPCDHSNVSPKAQRVQ